ncbi:cupin-like domain-containing protein [Hyalangium versicolor]|uniref:cupin-like domain-containing protein n=1 Tax=Hyalangium versicolor TaxID=2861190 RepID=UPI001CC9CADF|nr:cupin-like domain-containing protein [Hyalangium versicolor]
MKDERQASSTPAIREWIAENLALGVSQAVLLSSLLQAGLAPERARAELEAAAAHPAVRKALRLLPRRARLKSLLEAYSALYQQSGTAQQAERRARLAPSEFFERYYFQNRPVIIEGLLADWPALQRWSPDFFADRFGDAQVEVMAGRDAEAQPDLHAERLRASLSMREYVARLQRSQETNDIYMVARNSLLKREAFRPLLEDIRAPQGFIRPEVHVPDSVHLWFGPAGTWAALHHDHLNVLFCQVLGRKRFRLIPSFELLRAYNHQGLYSAVDPRTPDPARFPEFEHATVLDFVVGPGDALLIPVGWWHAVQALDVSISVTFVSFDLPERNTYWRNCWIGPDPDGEGAEMRKVETP